MNPTVSVSRYFLPSTSNPRVVGSSVSKSRSRTETAAPGQPPVGLELRLTGAARADAAAEALEVLPQAPHPREVVLELGELDLQLALRGHGVLGEDVEDELRPVDDPRAERILEEPLLHRVELVVDEEALGLGAGVPLLQLLKLALADVRPPGRPRAMLHHAPDRLDARRPRELLDLGELVVRVRSLGQNC